MMKGERMTNEQGKRQRETRTVHGTDPRAFGPVLLFIAKPRHNYYFFLSAEQLLLASDSGSADKEACCD